MKYAITYIEYVCMTRINCLINEYSVRLIACLFDLLKPTSYVMHHQQFNIQQLYALPTLYLCVLYLSENKQLLVPFTA